MSTIDLKALRPSVERVKAYLDRRDAARGLDIEHIHGFDLGPNSGVELLASDLRALLKLADLAPAQQPAAALVTDTGLPELRDLLKIAAVYGEPILLSHISAGALCHAMTTGEPAAAPKRPMPPRDQALCNDGSEPNWAAYAAEEAAAPVSGDVALPEQMANIAATERMREYARQAIAYDRITYGQQCSDAGFNAGLAAAYSTYAPTEDEAWSIYNVQGEWGHEPTAKGLFIDGYRAASPKSAIVALRDLVDELLAGDDEGLIQHSDAMQRAIRALKGE